MTRRLRPARIEDVVDGRKLRAQLTAAALDNIGSEDAARKEALRLLHGALFRGRMIAKERLEHGADGHETAALLSQVQDEVLSALYDYTTTHVFRSRNPTKGERFSLVAVGGYGRGQLAPSSDIDLLFLRSYKTTPWSESVTEFMLYALWDMGLKVGHSSRSTDECVRLAKEDATIATALLEARHIAGDVKLTEELAARYRRDIVKGHQAWFVDAKLKERAERHAKVSRYVVEPNLKEGKGGLRDLHTLWWISRFLHGWPNPQDYVRSELFTAEEVRRFMRASNFLWTVRCHLHYLAGRPEERLTFDVQPELASRMGYKDRHDAPAVERFMKRYFLAARDVGNLTRIFTSKFEEDQKARSQQGLARFLPKPKNARQATGVEGFAMEGGRLVVDRPDLFHANPVNLLRLFRVADEKKADIHPDVLAEVTRSLGLITPAVRENPEAAAEFCAIAASPHDPALALQAMSEAGVLGRFLPEFGRVVARTQFNMYHHYTVDEHTLRAIQWISDIEHGRLAEEHPLATDIFPKLINRRALFLAMLLHDTGKGQGDQCIAGEISARGACTRLGLPEDEVELIAWLVRHHLDMSDTAQKRDIGDPRTIARFAELVGSPERLRLLVVLTVADIRAVGPGVWNGWKGQLLRDLYRLTEAVLRGGISDEAGILEQLGQQASEAQAALAARAGHAPEDALLYAGLENAYWLSFDTEAHVWHASEARKAGTDPQDVHVAARAENARGVTELMVIAPDRPRLFARLAAALATAGADISDARIFTTRDGRAFDVFSILDAEGRPFGAVDPSALKRLLERLRDVAAQPSNAPMPAGAVKPPSRRTAAFRISPWVSIDTATSPAAVLVEASGRDRPGLLADLAIAFADAGLSITSAHIDGYGERVSDTFYVVDAAGAKPAQDDVLGRLKLALERALSEGEPEAPRTLAHEVMATARASTAR
jgi:[protein-PII] uridylyltransferase